MSNAIEAKRSPEGTWLDWMPEWSSVPDDDELITRAQLISKVNEQMAGQFDMLSDIEDPGSEFHDIAAVSVQKASDFAKPVTERTLRNWETRGILPRPIMRVRDGVKKALYPYWMVSVVQEVASSPRYGQNTEKLTNLARWWMWRRLSFEAIGASSEWKALQDAGNAFIERYVKIGGERPASAQISFHRGGTGTRPFDYYPINPSRPDPSQD